MKREIGTIFFISILLITSSLVFSILKMSSNDEYASKRPKLSSGINLLPIDPKENYQQSIKIRESRENLAILSLFHKIYPIRDKSIICDFEFDSDTCALWFKHEDFGRRKSELLSRIQVLHNNYKQIFVYCLIDKKRSDPSINDVNKEMIFQPVSLIECNSLKELINFVELLKLMEKSKNGANKEKVSNNALDQTTNILKQIKILNKQNITNICNHYNSMADLLKSNITEFEDIPSLGEKRIMSIIKTLQHSFKDG